MRTTPVALTVAGSDSGGGAGIQADLRTFQALGVYGLSAVTAVTAQDTERVRAVQAIDPDVVAAQIDAVLTDIGADAAKTGMLANAGIVRAVAERLRIHAPPHVVVDPVLISSGGDTLLDAAGMEALMDHLMPLATVVTPNLAEASVMVGRQLETEDDLAWAARRIVALGARAAVVTGGHLAGAPVDVLFDGHDVARYPGERVDATSTHGTGCMYSAAVAALLARGRPLGEAAREAKAYVAEALWRTVPLAR